MARVQSNPTGIARLLGSEDPSTRQAREGCAYNLAQRPFQIRRPRPIRLKAGGLQAATEEIERLEHVCQAIESALEAYPPQALLPRILHKVINERVHDMVLVTPLLLHASWWPTLLQVGTAVPIVLPRRHWVTTDPAGNPSWSQNWSLVAWRVSGQLEYARKCRRSTQRNLFEWQIRHQIRSVLGSSWATVRNETSLMMAATHDAVP